MDHLEELTRAWYQTLILYTRPCLLILIFFSQMFECVKAADYSKTYIWTIICSVVILLWNWIWYKLLLWKSIIKWNNIFYALTFFSDCGHEDTRIYYVAQPTKPNLICWCSCNLAQYQQYSTWRPAFHTDSGTVTRKLLHVYVAAVATLFCFLLLG